VAEYPSVEETPEKEEESEPRVAKKRVGRIKRKHLKKRMPRKGRRKTRRVL
jgi:hypothetical protein